MRAHFRGRRSVEFGRVRDPSIIPWIFGFVVLLILLGIGAVMS